MGDDANITVDYIVQGASRVYLAAMETAEKKRKFVNGLYCPVSSNSMILIAH